VETDNTYYNEELLCEVWVLDLSYQQHDDNAVKLSEDTGG
jgi:hypothetical protein